MASQKGLGKGLGALLGDFTEEPLEKSAYQLLPIYKVEPNPDQPRQDFDEEELQALADSITVHGIIQPLTVREMPNGYYQIIAGERRMLQTNSQYTMLSSTTITVVLFLTILPPFLFRQPDDFRTLLQNAVHRMEQCFIVRSTFTVQQPVEHL